MSDLLKCPKCGNTEYWDVFQLEANNSGAGGELRVRRDDGCLVGISELNFGGKCETEDVLTVSVYCGECDKIIWAYPNANDIAEWARDQAQGEIDSLKREEIIK